MLGKIILVCLVVAFVGFVISSIVYFKSEREESLISDVLKIDDETIEELLSGRKVIKIFLEDVKTGECELVGKIAKS